MQKQHVSLKSMAEDKDLEGVGKITNFAVDPRIIEVKPGFNGRPLDQDHVRAMAEGWKNGATFPPLDVMIEDGVIFVVDGHHRHAGALLAISEGLELKTVEARHFRGNDVDRIMLMVTSQQGLPMTPLQLGIQYQKLIGLGWQAQQVAARSGKSVQHVRDCIVLAESNSDVHKMLSEKTVTASVALATVKKHGGNAGKVLESDLNAARAAGKTKVTAKTSSAKAMTLIDAIRAEMASGGKAKAHDLCPKYAEEIQYLRSSSLGAMAA